MDWEQVAQCQELRAYVDLVDSFKALSDDRLLSTAVDVYSLILN
jgi:hypothetical protein